MHYLEKFNSTFRDFVQDLCIAYPNDGDFRMCKMILGTTLATNEELICRFFYNKIVSVYGEQIQSRDDAFFISKDFSKFAEKISGASAFIAKLKECWVDMTEENKECVWRYMKVLMALSKRHMEAH